jgi:ABC-type multidrug transport system ATPase subunit
LHARCTRIPVVILDEPNSDLDQEGDAALLATLADLKQKDRTVIVITHRSNVLGQVDKILVLRDGQVVRYGRGSDSRHSSARAADARATRAAGTARAARGRESARPVAEDRTSRHGEGRVANPGTFARSFPRHGLQALSTAPDPDR